MQVSHEANVRSMDAQPKRASRRHHWYAPVLPAGQHLDATAQYPCPAWFGSCLMVRLHDAERYSYYFDKLLDLYRGFLRWFWEHFSLEVAPK